MALNTIVKNKVMSYADGNIFTIINNRSNVADPKNRGSTGKFVYRNDPWSKGIDYQSFPYIILRFPRIERDKVSISGSSKDFLWTQDLVVRTAMNGAINNATNTSVAVTDMYAIIDDLNETFDSTTIKDQLRGYGVFNLNIVVLGNDELTDSDGKHIFETNLELTYNTRLSGL